MLDYLRIPCGRAVEARAASRLREQIIERACRPPLTVSVAQADRPAREHGAALGRERADRRNLRVRERDHVGKHQQAETAGNPGFERARRDEAWLQSKGLERIGEQPQSDPSSVVQVLRTGAPARPVAPFRAAVVEPPDAKARGRIDNADRRFDPACVHQHRTDAAAKQFQTWRQGEAARTDRAIRADDRGVVVPEDQAVRTPQRFAPKSVNFAGSGEGRRQNPKRLAETPRHSEIGVAVVDLHDIDGVDELGVVVAAPAGHLRAFQPSKSRGVALMDGIRPGPDGAGEGDVHPCLEVRPGCIAAADPPQGRVGRFRRHLLPGGEWLFPLGIERREIRILRPQPISKGGQRGRAEVEVPGGGEIRNASLVRQAVIKRLERRIKPCGCGNPLMDTG